MGPVFDTRFYKHFDVDVCLLGCLEFGEEFVKEFIQSTSGWDGPWLNDRKTGRRPWVHTPAYKVIDRCLREYLTTGLETRKLPEEFVSDVATSAQLEYIRDSLSCEADETPLQRWSSNN